MSRIGSSPIQLPSSVEVKIDGSTVTVTGPKGELMKRFDPSITVVQEDRVLRVQRASDEDRQRALHGLTRSLLANMVTGVSEGFQRRLDLIGTWYFPSATATLWMCSPCRASRWKRRARAGFA